MAELISLPFKKSVDVDIVKPLRNLLQSTYSSSDDFSESLNELARLRSAAIWKIFDKSSLDPLYNYYDQLVSLESKVPPQEVQIPFKWKDAFDKGSLFSSRISLTVNSLSFERLCIQWNMAAMSMALAAQQPLDTDESLKTAAKLLQQAAGLFLALKAGVVPVLQREPTPDLQPDTLHALHLLALAQAQEVFAYKGIRDGVSAAALAKVCGGAGELLADCARAAPRDLLRTLTHRDMDLQRFLSLKQSALSGLSQYYAAVALAGGGGGSEGKVAAPGAGEQIARLTLAVEALAQPAQHNLSSYIQEAHGRAARLLAAAQRDNDFIYHERVPPAASLPAPPRATVAKAAPAREQYGTAPALWAALAGAAAARRVAAAAAERAHTAQPELDKLRQDTQLLNTVLESLSLPACLEEAGAGAGGAGVGGEVARRAEEVRAAGGEAALEALLRDLPELLQRNQDILEEAARMLREEEATDSELRTTWGARWRRSASAALTGGLRANADKYRDILDNATRADAIVRDKYNKHKEGIALLSGADSELASRLPAPASPPHGDPALLTELRGLMDEVTALKRDRDDLEGELKGSAERLRAALERDAGGEEPPDAERAAPLAPLLARAAASRQRQQELLTRVQDAHARLMQARGAGAGQGAAGGASAREAAVTRLVAAHDAYTELSANLREGAKFYNDLTQLLVAFQNKVSDYCFARRTEKEELLKELTQEASRGQAGGAPAAPAHHHNVEPPAVKREAPPRPPPPAPAPAAPPAAAAPAASLPYPTQPTGMPVPYAAAGYAPYPPMPAAYNPYATLPFARPHYPAPAPQYQYPAPPPPQHYAYYPYPPPPQ